MSAGRGTLERQARYRRGHFAEHAAAMALRLKGYRVLGRRVRTPLGEIDLIARRGRRIAFVEVKRRASREAALDALSDGQRRRMSEAAEFWLSRRPHLSGHDIGLDAVLVLPWRWPEHIPDVLNRL